MVCLRHRGPPGTPHGPRGTIQYFAGITRRNTITRAFTNLYSVLRVDNTASELEIKAAFRALAKVFHPDAQLPTSDARKFQAAKQAYQVLNDPAKRRMYDKFGIDAPGLDIDVSLYDDRMEDGDDVSATVRLSFEEAVFGGVQRVVFDKLRLCAECNGIGTLQTDTTCPMCRGKRSIMRKSDAGRGASKVQAVCPACKGSGKCVTRMCSSCMGKQRIAVKSAVRLKVPAGADTGTLMLVKNRGDDGLFGGRPGHLYVRFEVEQSGDNISRDGPDLYSEASIPIWAAILGSRLQWAAVSDDQTLVAVRTPDTVVIPPGTQHGDIIELTGGGLSIPGDPSACGNHYVTVTVDIPQIAGLVDAWKAGNAEHACLTDREREVVAILSQLRQLRGWRDVDNVNQESPARAKSTI